jgi:glutathione S-transferase
MRATLFGLPASHPTLAAELMLRHKRIGYRRVDLVPGVHRGVLRALGFGGNTVPAIRLDGARLQGSSEIALALDALVPGPPLFPADPERRQAVIEADRWGNEVLQGVPRRLIWHGLSRDRSTIATYLVGARNGIPTPVAVRTAAPIVAIARRANRATDESTSRDLAALPGLMDRVDELIEQGVIGGSERNAADFQIATSVSLLLTMDDVRPLIEGRPAERHAREIVPGQPGQLPHVYAA